MDTSQQLIAETALANRALGASGQSDMVWGHASMRDPDGPDVNSVVHTHAPAAVSFASLDVPLLAISHDGVEFAEPRIVRFTRTGALISSAELGRSLAETIGDGVGCLVPQHGLVTVGPDTATAVMRALLLARACHNQLQAMAAGPIRLWSDSAEIALKRAGLADLHEQNQAVRRTPVSCDS